MLAALTLVCPTSPQIPSLTDSVPGAGGMVKLPENSSIEYLYVAPGFRSGH